ncbi:MAG: helix-turn-helix domain-containing protein [Prevotellaceae bacterium]|jgi:transcriptional regulator with XRE-family HTH domain|nr:helix-turn-helix domain-containing protein [Prevotellaceae bacterium]
MNERLTIFLRAEQLSPAQFADVMGIQRSGVSHILSGRNKPGFDFFSTFLQKFPAVNIEWLISGRGKMFKDMETQSLFPEQAVSPEPQKTTPYEETLKETAIDFVTERAQIQSATPAKTTEPRCIEKVMILYSDGTFSDFVRS